MTAGVQVFDHAGQLPAASWDALLSPDDIFLSSRMLRVSEATNGVAMNYLTTWSADALTGGLATAWVERSAPWLMGRPDTLLEHCASEGLPGAADCRAALPADLTGALLPSLVCGGRHLGRTRTLVRGARAGAADDIDHLVAAAERLAWAGGARSAAFLYVDERDVALRRVLARRGYLSYTSGRYSWLPVPADGFAGYLGRFSSHRRTRILAERRRLRAAGAEVRIEPLSDALLPPLAELETSLLAKYGLRGSPAKSESIFARILRECGTDALVCTARRTDRLCGFALILARGDQWHAYRGGFDYAVQGGLPVYFEVAFYHLVEAAAAAGVTAIHYGTGSAPTKRSRGCAGTDQYAFVLPADAPGGAQLASSA
ncbi:MAG TPA: GNAT family N-acetyltransferase [Streptosporangiaceae bacterium]|nr:GNAT family N-acetyltransferase [Streptosporangiaceae bacterium]